MRGGRGAERVVIAGNDEHEGRGMEVSVPEMGNGCCLVSGSRLRNLGEAAGLEEGSDVLSDI